MENNNIPEKKILKPSVVHDKLPEVHKPEHLRKTTSNEENALPENPERNYHHEENRSTSNNRVEIKQADDDVWNGEDA